ncbi:hypothetical protein BVY03_02920 [bacterium K02(2017)]|nr:hypothetical protein BVY03_02920 [bacterium K02(2017)]
MNDFLIPNEQDPTQKRYLYIFLGTVSRTLIACVASFILFPVQSGIISVFFASFSLIPCFENILDKNKNDIWQNRVKPLKANADMALSLILIFSSVLFTYAVIVFIQSTDTTKILFFSQIHDTMTHTHLKTTKFGNILANRTIILITFFFISVVYRVGSIFILVWLASVWGVIYGLYFKSGLNTDLPEAKNYLLILSLSGFVVLIIRTLAFVTASMSGVFISKALSKYSMASKEFFQVFKAVMSILAVSALLLLGAVYIEYLLLTQ